MWFILIIPILLSLRQVLKILDYCTQGCSQQPRCVQLYQVLLWCGYQCSLHRLLKVCSWSNFVSFLSLTGARISDKVERLNVKLLKEPSWASLEPAHARENSNKLGSPLTHPQPSCHYSNHPKKDNVSFICVRTTFKRIFSKWSFSCFSSSERAIVSARNSLQE